MMVSIEKSCEVVLRNVEKDDLAEISSVHLESFPDGAMSLLGGEAVRRYYLWLLEGPHETEAVCATISGKITGFCFGGVFHGATAGYLQRNRIFLILRTILRPWLIANPTFRERLKLGVNVLSRWSQQGKENMTEEYSLAHSFGILAIAVHPNYRKIGIGRLLMEKAERLARAQEYQMMHLTVTPENMAAIRFYEKLGWDRQPEQSGWRGVMRKFLYNPPRPD